MPSGVFTLKQVEQAIGQGAWTNQPPISVNYLVVAGGGGGAGNSPFGAGGGGGGGLLQGSFSITAGTSYTVTVGSGGTGGSAGGGERGTTGSSSVFGPISASGGGGGGAQSSIQTGLSGGSGGGGGQSSGAGGQGTAGQGNAGGNGATDNATYTSGAGGGGAGTVGLNGSSGAAGNGGAGVASDISGSRVTYAGGGGGASDTKPDGAGGAGGGGAGGGTSGSANLGGGGGGKDGSASGGNGGSGIVIVSYPGTTQWFTGGTLSYGNGNIVHSFYSSGTLAPTTPSTYVDTGYQISRSLRFNSADSAYLNRTPASASNQKTWTWSGWVKKGSNGYMFTTSNLDINNATYIYFTADFLRYWDNTGSGGSTVLSTTAVYRDVSAWYHIVLAVDTTQATAANRARLYVNGVEITAFNTANYPPQNTNTYTNAAVTHYIAPASTYFNGYMTEINFIDGQALTPQSFGYYNPDTGVWSPLKFVGTYGTNGFYLNFSDNSNTTAATLGKDYSGNGNNWTPNNFSVTAGAGNDSLVDSPTAYGTDTGVGGTVRGNYCTLNPLIQRWLIPTATFSNGNLDTANTDASNAYVFGTTSVNSGKFYWEVTVTAVGSSAAAFSIGVDSGKAQFSSFPDLVVYGGDGNKYVGSATPLSYGASYTTNDIIGVALDKDAGTVTFYKNGASQGAISLPTNVAMVPYCSPGITSGSATFNFGQRPFAYTAPSGFLAICTQNLPTPTIGATTATQAANYFNPVIYAGDSTSNRTITTGLQSDFVWIKNRTSTGPTHILFDVIRGAGQTLYSSSTSAEVNNGGFYVQQFNSTNFLLGSSDTASNDAGQNYVSWVWRANGAGSTNTAGSITSTVSANTTSGFSIVTYTGTGANATIGHGLGVAPRMIIVKQRNGVNIWPVYNEDIGNTQYLRLQGDNPAATFNVWQNTSPTSSVFYISTDSTVNTNTGTYVAYCFAPIAGYSAFGSYTGNGSTDGTFVYTGFRPAYLLIKRTDTTGDWIIWDAKRNTFNALNSILYPNLSNAEATAASVNIDFLSNGFKLRASSSALISGTFIFAAFAESPFKYALAR